MSDRKVIYRFRVGKSSRKACRTKLILTKGTKLKWNEEWESGDSDYAEDSPDGRII